MSVRNGAIIETIDLHKTYFGAVNTHVLHGVNLNIGTGEFVSLIGQSGAGKSTQLNILGGLDRPTEGQLLIMGKNVSCLSEKELAELGSERIGFIFQHHFLLDEFTCLENVLMPILIRDNVVSRREIDRMIRLLKRVGLEKQLHKPPTPCRAGKASGARSCAP